MVKKLTAGNSPPISPSLLKRYATNFTATGIQVGCGQVVVMPAKKANQKKRDLQQAVLGPCIYNPRFDAVEVKIGKNVQNWDLLPRTPGGASSALSPRTGRDRILEVISKEVKPPKKRVTREDIEREDEHLIHSFIDRLCSYHNGT
jgi:hypothetical protein